ncbi:MAG: hypothetical protein R6V04_13855 [bacterium]
MKVFKTAFYWSIIFLVLMLLTSPVWSKNGAEDYDVAEKKEFHKSFLLQTDEHQPNLKSHSASRGKAFLLSFLLPGLGEWYAGSNKMAKIFLGTEVALWTTYFAFRMYGNWRKDDYKNFAVAHAHINPAGKDHDYFVNIEHYDDISAYNQTKLQKREEEKLYPENKVYSWKWNSKEHRLQYEQIRMSSDRAFSNSVLVVGIVVLNHLVSGIDAMRIAIKADKEKSDVKMGFIPVQGGGMQFCLVKRF